MAQQGSNVVLIVLAVIGAFALLLLLGSWLFHASMMGGMMRGGMMGGGMMGGGAGWLLFLILLVGIVAAVLLLRRRSA